MSETKTKYDAGPPDLAAIEARLAAASVPPFDFEAFCALYGHAPADLRALLAEVKRLRALLETERHARLGAEQNAQHWQEVAQLAKVAT